MLTQKFLNGLLADLASAPVPEEAAHLLFVPKDENAPRVIDARTQRERTAEGIFDALRYLESQGLVVIGDPEVRGHNGERLYHLWAKLTPAGLEAARNPKPESETVSFAIGSGMAPRSTITEEQDVVIGYFDARPRDVGVELVKATIKTQPAKMFYSARRQAVAA